MIRGHTTWKSHLSFLALAPQGSPAWYTDYQPTFVQLSAHRAMEGAFTHLGNHLVSDSASTINAGDDLSTIDADESILDGEYGRGNLSGGPRRRRHDDDETEAFDDDDTESMVSMSVDGANDKLPLKPEQEKELPPHACA